MKLLTQILFVVIACGVLVAMQYYAVWRRKGRPNVRRAAAILAFAAFGSLASLEAFFGFNRMVQWTDWYVVTSVTYEILLFAAIVAPLLLAAGALFALTTTSGKVLRIGYLSLNACMLAVWLWFFHQWRNYSDTGPDYAALHWPLGAEQPLPMRFVWSWWGLAAVVLLSVAILVPTVLYATPEVLGHADRLD